MEDESADIRRWLLPRLADPVVEVRGAPAPSLETPAPEQGSD
jgi:hypothetical protein